MKNKALLLLTLLIGFFAGHTYAANSILKFEAAIIGAMNSVERFE